MKLTDAQKRIYDVLNRTNLTDRDKAILISQLQEKLVSGENISTINGEDITKGGNIEIDNKSSEIYYTNMLLSIDSSSSNLTDDDINQYIGSWDGLVNAIKNNIPIFDKVKLEGSSLNQFGIIPIVAAITDDNSVDLAMFVGVDNSYKQFKIIKVSDNNYTILFAKKVILDTDNNADLLTDNKTIIGAINELDSAVKPYIIDLTALLAAQDSETISTAIGGIDNLNGTVQKNQVIFGILANGTVAVGIRVLGNQTTLTYFVDSVVGLTVNEVIITNTSGTLTKTANTHAVLTENMVVNNLKSDETTLPLSAAKGKILNKSIGQPIIEDIDLTTNAESGYFWNVNGTKTASSPWNISDSISLDKGDLLIVNTVSGSSVTSVITAVSNNGDFIDSLVAADGIERNSYSYIADKDCKVQLSYGSNTSAYIVKSYQNKAIVNTAFLHKIYETYGAVYNAETGYWEMYGLTDLTEEDMWDIYVENIGVSFGGQDSDTYILILWPFRNARIRFITTEDSGYSNLSGFIFCRNNHKLEVFRCNNLLNIESALNLSGICNGVFYGSINLKDVGIINVSLASIFISSGIRAFKNCYKLNRVLLKNLKLDVSFQDSPLLSYDSLNYLVTNAANIAAITVTVHPTTYSYLTGTAQPTEEVGGTSEEWQALVTTAQGKQITFAVAEDSQTE